MKRVIIHSDINHCYAQIEEMMHPELRHIPMAVGGSEEKRHGIILAKNDLAKACGVRTGESLREAIAKCPDLKIVHPSYEDYVYYTEKVKDIYRKYTDRVESFGLDEAWIDLTPSQRLFGDGVKLAKRIQDEIYASLGLNVSMGVSFNKVFAKLGSDIFKHRGFALIDEEHWKEMIWPMDAADLIMVGRHTEYKLDRMGISTIGELAACPPQVLQKKFGKMGLLLWRFANGLDDAPVHENGYQDEIKSIGNSKTLVHDVISHDQLREVLMILSQSTAARLRRAGKRGYVIHVWLRDSNLRGMGKQKRISIPADTAETIFRHALSIALSILPEHFALRSIGISLSDLTSFSGFDQPTLFEDPLRAGKQRNLEKTIVRIQEKYGFASCRFAGMKLDEELTDFDPLSTLHQIHPIAFLNGPI